MQIRHNKWPLVTSVLQLNFSGLNVDYIHRILWESNKLEKIAYVVAKTDLWPPVTLKPDVRLKWELVSSIKHIKLYDITA